LLKLLADENVPRRRISLLREHGVDVVRLQDLGVRGVNDRELVEIAGRLGRAILTRDHDFTLPLSR
jgi:predicted nuclease of predicted toxin-antitoxin system